VLNLEIVQGARRDWVLQILMDDNSAPTVFLNTDTLSANLWAGASQTALCNPGVTWNSAADGLVNITLSAANSALLTAGGVYQLQVFAQRSGGDPVCVVWVTVTCLPAAGSAAEEFSTYCIDEDLLTFAPWLEDLYENTSDTEGFYKQRLWARRWLDRIIVSRARPLAYIYNIMTPLTPWGPVEAPNYVIQGYLQADYLLVRDSTREIVARKALAMICEKQIGLTGDDPWPRRARHFHATAHNRLTTYRCELNVSSAPMVQVSDPTGGGAMALAVIKDGVVSQVIPQQFGSGYTDPTVLFSQGTGNAADVAATANVSGGLITSYTVTDGGSGFYQMETPDVAFNLGMISWR
jgi:hypothetical protein